MHTIIFVLLCLHCASYGQQLQDSTEQLPSNSLLQSQEAPKPFRALPRLLSFAKVSARRAYPFKALGLLLLAAHRAAAFNPADFKPCALLKHPDVSHLRPSVFHALDPHVRSCPLAVASAEVIQPLGTAPPPQYDETARYAYKDADGELIYILVRRDLEGGKKDFIPYRYRHAPRVGKKKIFTLYHLEELKDRPSAPILLVEGEKTAEAAADKMYELQGKQYIAMTWALGATGVSNADWSCLAGREVLIWPDNDKIGFAAAQKIQGILFEEGAKEVRSIDEKWLKERFPSKWDLADPWPQELSESELLEKSRGVQVHAPTLYHLEELKCKPDAPVVVVRGEEAADAASHKMRELQGKEYIGITWPGGPAEASKVDWSLLAGREVLIWPSNSAAGFGMVKAIESVLSSVGPKEVKMFDRKWLSTKFPKKWTPADPWPEELSKAELVEKATGMQALSTPSKKSRKSKR